MGNDKAVEKINLADKTIYWFKQHKALLQSGAVALCLSVTLFGCSPNVEATDINNEETTNNDVTIETTIEEIAKDDGTDLADQKSAVITAINLIKTEAEKLKENIDSIKGTPEMNAAIQQTVSEFDALYRFIIKGETYEGMTFEELVDENDQLEVIDSTMSLGEIITTIEPDYKEEIIQKFTDIKDAFNNSSLKDKVSDLAKEYGEKIENFIIKYVAKGYNYFTDLADKIQNEAENQKGQR